MKASVYVCSLKQNIDKSPQFDFRLLAIRTRIERQTLDTDFIV